ncbi:hypothetical protein FOE67_13915 [Streptomyces calidiresistens]|uniref:Uncharacterized protein n=1 Tax=Streptomyces calidiresistens TaxID=1485586 RepID=A0A7W3T4D9_9ACTN|nr:hypothetical protein [Streptomyces calidiresistens]
MQLYRPLGFHATLSFLEAEAGPYRTDEGALLRALDVLEAGRNAWHAELRLFDAERRLAKGRGARQPHPTERNPYREARWWGAPRKGALHCLSFLRDRHWLPPAAGDPVAADLHRCVDACLESGGPLGVEERLLLERCIRALRERLNSTAPDGKGTDRIRAMDLLRAARHVELAAVAHVGDA